MIRRWRSPLPVRRTIGLLALLLLVAAGDAAAQYVREIAPFRVESAQGSPYLNPFSGGLYQPRIDLADADGDGLPDLFALNPDGRLRLYHNEGNFRFRRVFPSAYDSVSVTGWFRVIDLNGDGRLDLLTSGPTSEVLVMYNQGTTQQPRFAPAVQLHDALGDLIRPQQATVPAFADIDSDGDADLFIVSDKVAFERLDLLREELQ